MSCSDVREEGVALLDGELAPERAQAVREHLEGCAECAREQRELEQLRAKVDPMLRATDGLGAPTDAGFAALWAQVEADTPAAARAGTRAGGAYRSGGRRGRVAMAFAAAAALALFVWQLVPGGEHTAPGSVAQGDRTAAPGAGPVPPELLEHPDMFVDFVIVRRLEKLRQLPDLIEEEGFESAAVGHG